MKDVEDNHYESTERRLAHVESTLAEQGAAIKALAGQIGNIGSKLDQLIDKNTDKPWGMLASWAGVVILVVALLGAPFVRDMDRIERITNNLNKELKEHQLSIGHPSVLERLKTLERELFDRTDK